MATSTPITLDTPIVVKVLFRGQTKKVRLPLRDLGANVLPDKLRGILQIQLDQPVVFERYSDSAAAYVTLNSDTPQVYKTLFRAAKAKLKLRLRATIPTEQFELPAPAAPTQPLVPMASHSVSSSETLTLSADMPVSPLIARSPAISKFEPVSPMTPTKPINTEGEALVVRPSTARPNLLNLSSSNDDKNPGLSPKPTNTCTSWVVYCNNCNQPMENEHFHCSVCDGGDYDLCSACIDLGLHCSGHDHWMVKRFVKNGCVMNSTTQRIAPKGKAEENQEVPGSFTDEKQLAIQNEKLTRTCNCCIKTAPEKEFVTCVSCDDYDLCPACHMSNKHGHHPGHTFRPAVCDTTLPLLASLLCKPGRNVRHSAVCDGCDKFIYGIRHKCLNCPDWDYCSDCVQNVNFIHPRHRFVPIYEPLAEPLNCANRHYGIFCDGPLCKDKENLSYIEGVRYKCAVCHDTDFCQNCEAHPNNKHNHTHPLIKFKTPVRSVNVTTVNDDNNGKPTTTLGDRHFLNRSTASDAASIAPSVNSATPVQTIVEVRPSKEARTEKEKIATRAPLMDPFELAREKSIIPDDDTSTFATEPTSISQSEAVLDAHFVCDAVIDGSKFCPGLQFAQIWTLRNPGPTAWPKGCSIRNIGGDNMLNVETSHPLSHADLQKASETNSTDRVVEIGEEFSFRIVLRAPVREGTAISYWRLKTADGHPFGHRLWCDISVDTSASPAMVQSVPSTLLSTVASQSGSSAMYERPSQAQFERMKIMQQSSQPPQFDYHQNMEHIQRVRKAAVERLLENRRNDTETAFAFTKSQPNNRIELTTSEHTAELPVVEKPVEFEAKSQTSCMIFPQLKKESPESSMYEETTSSQPKSSSSGRATSLSDDEFFEDAESITICSDDEAFSTDEEYDILDVSDEEIP